MCQGTKKMARVWFFFSSRPIQDDPIEAVLFWLSIV